MISETQKSRNAGSRDIDIRLLESDALDAHNCLARTHSCQAELSSKIRKFTRTGKLAARLEWDGCISTEC